jgi:hypothetical protein
MSSILRAVIVALVVLSRAAAAPAQEPRPSPAPRLADEQIEVFLRTATIVSTRGAGNGVTNSRRATLTDGQLSHDAHIQTVDIQRSVFEPRGAPAEFNFKDTYRYNIAGYRLARLLGMDNVPVSVERRVGGNAASVTWWVDDVMFDERGRVKLPDIEASGPSAQRTAAQLAVMRVFDELIQNKDRNQGNIVWTRDWKLWLIDHTRAFRLGEKLLKAESVLRCERSIYARLRTLTKQEITQAMAGTLNGSEIEALLDRRTAILAQIDARIARRGEPAVLFTLSP